MRWYLNFTSMIQVNEKSNSPAMLRSQCGQPSVNLRKSIYKSEKYVRKYLERHQVGAVAELKISAL